jgi:hypothetical protein
LRVRARQGRLTEAVEALLNIEKTQRLARHAARAPDPPLLRR